MEINDKTTANELKNQFKSKFRGLKLEFFLKKHITEEGSPKKDLIADDFKLSKNIDLTGSLEFNPGPDSSAADIETWFEDHLKLHVQVFRQAGQSWIETTKTDHYSLSEQMEISS